MSEYDISKQFESIEAIVEEQKQYFQQSELVKPLRSHEMLLGRVSLKFTTSPSLYRGFPAKVLDNPKTDSMTVLLDEPTISDMVEEYAKPNALTHKDLVRLYVGTGFANLVILQALTTARRKRMHQFFEALSEPLKLYSCTLDSKVFDDRGADETARRIVSDGHAQTARVNALRLRTGMFIETQPEPEPIRKNLETTFQAELQQEFDGKPQYFKTVGLFDATDSQVEGAFANNVENMVGLAFPMQKNEIRSLTTIL